MGEFEMSDIMNRLKSFHEYPLPEESPAAHDVGASLLRYPSAVKLAKAGFYRFLGCRGDEVKCYRCDVKFSGWEGRSPLAVHRILSPSCPHMLMTSLNTSGYDGGSGNDDVPVSTLDVYICHQESVNNRQNSSDGGSMYFERLRLLTFPSPTNQQVKEFAEQGFIYLTEGRGRCVFCKCDLLLQSENPTRTHETLSPNCPFVRKLDVGNIPQALEEAVRSRERELRGEDEESRHEVRPIVQHPQYSDQQTRLNSFRTWPVALIPSPHSLALAGFFYTRYGDKVQCFFCGITLFNWRGNPDPWSQHARQAPSCKFVEMEMGNHYLAGAYQYQVLTDMEPQRNNAGIENSLGLRPSLDMNALEAALSQYDVQQISQAILTFFLASHGFYPDRTLLLATLQAIDRNFIQLQRQGGQLHSEVQLRWQIGHLLSEVMEKNEMRLIQGYNLRQAQAEVIQYHTRELQAISRQAARGQREVSRFAEENRRMAEEMERLRRPRRPHEDAEDDNNDHLDTPEQAYLSDAYPECKVCCTEDAKYVLNPCKHLCGATCSSRFIGQSCPFCRSQVVDRSQIFLP